MQGVEAPIDCRADHLGGGGELRMREHHLAQPSLASRYKGGAVVGERERGHAPPPLTPFQPSSTWCSDSCSALLTAAQRAQATGSTNSRTALSTQSRKSLGSIASSSQQRSPYFPTNHP